jgi:hypothetical protein
LGVIPRVLFIAYMALFWNGVSPLSEKQNYIPKMIKKIKKKAFWEIHI